MDVVAKTVESGKLDGGPAIVKKTSEMLAADPDDPQTAGLAMQLASAFEQLPGGKRELLPKHVIVVFYTQRPALAKRGGAVVTCAATSGFMMEFDNRFFWMRSKRLRDTERARNDRGETAHESLIVQVDSQFPAP